VHELGLAGSILDEVRAQAERVPGARVVKVGVKVGEVSGVDTDALSFCFESLVRETEFAPVAIEIEQCYHKHHCPRCGRDFRVYNLESRCVICGETHTQFIAGDELEINYLEVDGP
jgi:hydrogenase nickel incorporation protein HypA/HybF